MAVPQPSTDFRPASAPPQTERPDQDAVLAAELERLVDRLRAYYPDFDEQLIRNAFEFACQAHETQRRQSGEPYILHPIAVAHILIDLKLDPACIAAGLLHDVVEDTSVTLADISARFGAEIAAIVDSLTKLNTIEGRTKEDAQAGSYRKMFLAMVDDIGVVLIKLADRLHNMRTLDACAAREAEAHRPARRWRSTRRWPTASASGSSSGSWKTWPSATCNPEAVRGRSRGS